MPSHLLAVLPMTVVVNADSSPFKPVTPVDVDLLRRESIKILQMMQGLAELGLIQKKDSCNLSWDQIGGFHMSLYLRHHDDESDSTERY